MNLKRIQTFVKWREYLLKMFQEVQVFLRFCNFYRRFIRGYIDVVRPFIWLLKGLKNGKAIKKMKFSQRQEQQQAFLTLFKTFIRTPVLRHFNLQRPSKVETDALDGTLGCIYSQWFKDNWHLVAFYSKQFKNPEINYRTLDKEIYFIVKVFKYWRHYLKGNRYTIEVWIDH